MLQATAVGSGNLTADFGHFPEIEEGKISEFYIFDDSQKMTATMNAAWVGLWWLGKTFVNRTIGV